MIRIVQASLSILMFTTVNEPANSKSLNADFWLFGEFTQNVPCKGDGSDPAELKARISPDQIEAKAMSKSSPAIRPRNGRVEPLKLA